MSARRRHITGGFSGRRGARRPSGGRIACPLVPGRLAIGRDDGQLLPLVIGYAAILALLITVVVDASTVFLQRRALSAAADGAALAAANAVDPAAVAEGRIAERGGLVVTPETASGAVARYVADAHLAERFPGFAVAGVDVSDGGAVVAVTLAARVPLPFVSVVAQAWSDGVPIGAAARARAPLVDPVP